MSKLLVLSGGMDSTTLLYDRQDEIKLAVSFFYGSKHNKVEIAYAKESCRILDIDHMVVNMVDAFKSFGSALLDRSVDVPEGHYEEETMKATVVPFRNGIMLSVAAGLAESKGLDTVMIANHAGDHAVYPDCRSDFIASMNSAVFYGTGQKVNIIAPYTHLTKEDIANKGCEIGVPYETTYSCYKGGAVHCGRCSTCAERIWSLRHHHDATEYLDKDFAKAMFIEKGEW